MAGTAIFDYIESMMVADNFQVPPAELNEYVFQFYTWKGSEAPAISGPADQAKEGIVFLSHADTDLLTLHRVIQSLPEDFPRTLGINLLAIKTEAHMSQLLDREIAGAKIIILRILGRPSTVPGFSELIQRVQKQGQHLIIVSGTSAFNPEYAAAFTVTPVILQETLNYLDAGGHTNVVSLLHFLSDHLLMTGFGFDAPVILPQHGIYHPELPENASLTDWSLRCNPAFSTIGITFTGHIISVAIQHLLMR